MEGYTSSDEIMQKGMERNLKEQQKKWEECKRQMEKNKKWKNKNKSK